MRRRKSAGQRWATWPDERLLDQRLNQLGLTTSGPFLKECIARLHDELAQRGILFRPHYWLSTEWFTPDGVPGIAIPFYLAHPRLMLLERRQMLEVEGGTRDWCMRILRHEAGHAIDNAYRLHRRREWQRVFGRYSVPYPEHYSPRPYSKSFVLHLDYWYAQAHPAEDFAETFAVWLKPKSPWRKQYKGWPALRKLEYVDQLMHEIGPTRPLIASRARPESVARLRMTLNEYYRSKRASYGEDRPEFYDRDLHRLFPTIAGDARAPSAAAFLRRIRAELRRKVAYWTGSYQYTIDQVLQEMIDRTQALRLKVERPEHELKQEAMILLTVQTMNYLHAGYHRVAL